MYKRLPVFHKCLGFTVINHNYIKETAAAGFDACESLCMLQPDRWAITQHRATVAEVVFKNVRAEQWNS